MARITKPLTNTEVQHAKPKPKEYSLTDGAGLLLRVKPNGSKIWLFNYYRPYTKKRTNIGFGTFPETSLAEARKKREHARQLLAKDIDPKEQKTKEQNQLREAHNNTLRNIALQWHAVKKTTITPNTAIDIWRSFELHLFPPLGDIPLHKITAPIAIEALKPIAAKGSLETVRRLCQRLNEVMEWAMNSGVVTSNPLSGIRKVFQTPSKSHMPTLTPSQLPEFTQAISRANIKTTTRCLIEWQLHTMVRPSEAAGTKWAEIDLEQALWVIPGERMKKKRIHSVPLTPQTIEILEIMRPISGHREHIFPSDKNPRGHIHAQTANAAIKRMNLSSHLVAHGMRSLASTTLNEQEFNPDIIEAALAHLDSNEVRRAYNRTDYIEKRREMMCWWSDHIEKSKQ